MAKKAVPSDEDEEQSRRFIKAASELEAAGELNLTEAEAAFEHSFRRMVKPKTPQAKSE